MLAISIKPKVPLTAITSIDRRTLTDDRLDMLGNRFQANRILALMGITFEEYLESPEQYDRIAVHLAGGGGCRVERGRLVMQWSAGQMPHTDPPDLARDEDNCTWCGRWWSDVAGGLNANDLCPECANNLLRIRMYTKGARHDH